MLSASTVYAESAYESVDISDYFGDEDEMDETFWPILLLRLLLEAVKTIFIATFCLSWISAVILTSSSLLTYFTYYGYLQPTEEVLSFFLLISVIEVAVLALVIIVLLLARPRTMRLATFSETYIWSAFPVVFKLSAGIFILSTAGLLVAFLYDPYNMDPDSGRIVLYLFLFCESFGVAVAAHLKRSEILGYFLSKVDGAGADNANHSPLWFEESTHGQGMGRGSEPKPCGINIGFNYSSRKPNLASVTTRATDKDHLLDFQPVLAQSFDPEEDHQSLFHSSPLFNLLPNSQAGCESSRAPFSRQLLLLQGNISDNSRRVKIECPQLIIANENNNTCHHVEAYVQDFLNT